MRSLTVRGLRAIAAPLVVMALTGGCSPPEAQSASDGRRAPPALSSPRTADELTPELRRELARIRAVTARFASFDRAMADGWSVRVTECMASEHGGQGIHYGHPALIDDGGALDPLRPELLMYEPQPDGSRRYVGIEYIVPVGDWRGSVPPRLLGRDLHLDERYGNWVLHVWWEPNARGIFANWNPGVSCAAAR